MTQIEKELIDEKFIGIHARMDANSMLSDEQHKNINEILVRIEMQTLKTNGRVNLLERFQWTLTGKIIGISSAIGVVFGVVTFLLS